MQPQWPLPQKTSHPREFTRFCTQKLGLPPQKVREDIHSWVAEDAGAGCVSLWPNSTMTAGKATAYLLAKEACTVAGLHVMLEVFRVLSDGNCQLYSDVQDGQKISKGTVLLAAEGDASALLLAERVCINFGAHMSGIATKTTRVLDALKPYPKAPTLLETRKTTPGLRVYEKYATRIAGARNHRHGLDGGAMLKENNLRASSSLKEAVIALKKEAPLLTKIECEVTHMEEFSQALLAGADVIMLDNFSAEDIQKAVQMRNAKKETTILEISGNLDKISPEVLANSGVDVMSMGALIHQATWVDFSLQLYPQG